RARRSDSLGKPIELQRGDRACAAFERAADPLHCARINTEAFCNDAHTWSPRSRQGIADSFFKCGSNWRAPQALPLALGPRKPGTDSFLNDGPLELGEHAHHLKHRLACRCPGVEALLAQEQVDLEGVKFG